VAAGVVDNGGRAPVAPADSVHGGQQRKVGHVSRRKSTDSFCCEKSQHLRRCVHG
jgi:hypothetical protein